MNAFPERYARGAKLLRELQALKPGQTYRMSAQMLSDVEVPANPLDQQTPDFLAKWMQDRMPFYCHLTHSVFGKWWEISRPESAE